METVFLANGVFTLLAWCLLLFFILCRKDDGMFAPRGTKMGSCVGFFCFFTFAKVDDGVLARVGWSGMDGYLCIVTC